MRTPQPLLLSLLLTCCMLLAACGKNNSSNEGAIKASIDSLEASPSPAYQGNPVTFTFAITPEQEGDADKIAYRLDFGDGEAEQGGSAKDTTLTHAFEVSGDFTVTLTALDGDTTVATESTTLTVLAPIEVSIDGVRGQPANVDAGQTLSVSATLTNNLALDVEAPLELFAYLSPSPGVSLEDLDALTPLGSSLVEASGAGAVLGAGKSRELAFEVSVPAGLMSGDYYLVVMVDKDNIALDTNRQNNLGEGASVIRVTNPMQIEPDLVVLDVVAAPDRAFPELSSVTRGLRVVNRGGLDLFDIVVETYLSIDDAVLSDDDRLIHTSAPIMQLAARGGEQELIPTTFVLDQAITPPANGQLEVYVIVKAYSRDDIMEGDDTNNILAATTPILVTDQLVDGPDIVVREFSISPERTFLDGALSYQMTLANEGTADVASFLCRVYLGDEPRVNTLKDQPVDSINIPSLASDSELVLSDTITISALFDPGTYYLYVICDPNDLLGESFRSNNQKIYPNPITITDQADVDMTVASVKLPPTASEGSMITVEAELCATGTNATGQTQASLYQSPGNRVDFNSPPVASVEVPNINPGTCATISFELTASCEQFQERYAFGVVADALGDLPETNEQNNARSGDNQLIVDGTFCTCTEDAFEPNDRPFDAKTLMSGASELALCTAGTCDFFKTAELGPGDSVIVRNMHSPEQGVLSTKLFDPSGLNGLDVDRDRDGEQEVAAFLTAGGQYIIEVCGSETSTRNLYSLDVEILQQSTGIDLIARDLTLPVRDTFSIGARLNLNALLINLGRVSAATIPVEVRISPDANIDANDALLTSFVVDSVAASSSLPIARELTIPTSLLDGDYFIGLIIDPNATLAETDTTNNTATSRRITVATQCYDPLEPNDTFMDAFPITGSGTFSNLISCNSADDYYEICVPDGKKLTATITFAHAMGDLDLYLYDDQQQAIDSSATKTDTEQVAIAYVNGAQCYYAYVQKVPVPNQPAENLYALEVDIQDVNPALLCQSYAEPNDSFDTATSLLAASEQTQRLDRCPVADDDFYFFDITTPGQTVSIRGIKSPGAQQGTLRLQLYNPNRTPSLNQETAPDQPIAQIKNFSAPQVGRYWVQVTVSGNARNVTYELEVDGLSGVDLAPRNLSIGPGSYRSGDVLRIGFDLSNLGTDPTGTTPGFEIFFGSSPNPDPANDILLGSYSAPGPVAGSSSTNIFELTNVPAALPQGTYYVHVVVEATDDINPANNTSSIPVQVVP